MVLIFMFRTAGVQKRWWVLLLAPVMLMYVGVTGFRASAIRAALMVCCYYSAYLVGRKPDAVTALALAAVLLVAHDAGELFSVGFILSFSIVAGLLAASAWFSALQDWIMRQDPWRIQEESLALRMCRRAGKTLAGLAAVSVCAWIVSAPLSAQYFNQVSLVSLPANLVAVPATFFIVVSGVLSLLFSAMPAVSEVFNLAASVFLDVLLAVIRWLGDWPYAALNCVSPGVGGMVVFFAGLMLFLRGGKRTRMFLPGAAVAVAAVMSVCFHADSWVMTFPTRQGEAVLVKEPWRDPSLINPGSAYENHQVRRWLAGMGINRLEMVAMEVPLAARAGGTARLFEHFTVDRLWVPSERIRSSTIQRILETAEENNIAITKPDG